MAEWLELGIRHSGLNQTELADKAGIARATVNRLMLGKQDAEQATIKRLAKAMKYPFPDFDVAFPEADDSDAKRYKGGAGGPQAGRSVREPSPGDYAEADTAYLRFQLQMTRELSLAEREGASPQVQLRLIDLAEKVAVPIHGLRAKQFLDGERDRIRRGETLDGERAPARD